MTKHRILSDGAVAQTTGMTRVSSVQVGIVRPRMPCSAWLQRMDAERAARFWDAAFAESAATEWLLPVTESARACSYILSKEVEKTVQFWLLTLWLLTCWLLTIFF